MAYINIIIERFSGLEYTDQETDEESGASDPDHEMNQKKEVL